MPAEKVQNRFHSSIETEVWTSSADLQRYNESLPMQTASESRTFAAPALTEKAARQSSIRGYLKEWAITILVMLFASTTLAWSYVIPTGSMEDTVLIGDHIIVDKLAYAPAGSISKHLLPYEEPHRGDIIAFQYPVDLTQLFVKRVIGLPGERLKIVNQQVFINGTRLVEPYITHKSGYADPSRDNFPTASDALEDVPDRRRESRLHDLLEHNVANGEVTVPPGSYFVLGDNRDNSLDSRFWGLVPRENIVGKPLLVYWSYNTTTDMLLPDSGTNFSNHLIDMCTHFFTKTRWDRTFHIIRGYRYPDPIQ
jgi:signal peptidase I